MRSFITFVVLLCAAAASAEPAATVNGQAIEAAQVENAVAAAIAGRPVSKEELPRLQAETLTQLIDRTLIEQALAERRAKPAEVDKAIAALQARLSAQKLTFEQFLAQRKLSEQQFREQLSWQITWERYAAGKLDDEALEKYFNERRAEFDGSQVRAAHILLRPDKAGEAVGSPRMIERGARLRKAIVEGKISFEDAAARYSAGPSRHKQGDVGFIPRHGLMAEPFSRAAFALKKGELSEPVVTHFGVHLIRVSEVREGNKRWQDVREALRAAASQALFEQLASAERAKAKIEFGGTLPHFKPGTKELVLPSRK
jgi:parvulin-like peptidyl-prolyl isomerase